MCHYICLSQIIVILKVLTRVSWGFHPGCGSIGTGSPRHFGAKTNGSRANSTRSNRKARAAIRKPQSRHPPNETHVKKRRLVCICDWLPPDFGAVGQYALLSARELAKGGWEVTLFGLTSGKARRELPNPSVRERSRSSGYAAPAMKSKGWRSGSSGPSFRTYCS